MQAKSQLEDEQAKSRTLLLRLSALESEYHAALNAAHLFCVNVQN